MPSASDETYMSAGCRERDPNPDDSRMRMTSRRRAERAQSYGEQVTLVVYGWSSVEPGTLSWTFPSLRAALDAAHTMTNATQWAVVTGAKARGKAVDVDAARAAGEVLMETLPSDWLKIG